MKTLIYNGPLESGAIEQSDISIPFVRGEAVSMPDAMAASAVAQNPEFWAEQPTAEIKLNRKSLTVE